MYIPEDKSYTMTTSSGSATQAVNGNRGRKMVQLYCNPATATTSYDISITDKNSKVIYSNTSVVGKLVDYQNLPQYVYGNFTISIANATADEAFAVQIVFIEEAY